MIQYERNWTGRRVGMVTICDSQRPEVGAYAAAIVEAIDAVKSD